MCEIRVPEPEVRVSRQSTSVMLFDTLKATEIVIDMNLFDIRTNLS